MRRREQIAPDLTPIIDIVFLILIFFLVSSTFKKDEKALDLTLPSSTQAASKIKKEQLDIELDSTTIAFDGVKMSFDELDTILSTQDSKEDVVNIRIDKSVEYARVVELFDLLKKHQLYNLALQSSVE